LFPTAWGGGTVSGVLGGVPPPAPPPPPPAPCPANPGLLLHPSPLPPTARAQVHVCTRWLRARACRGRRRGVVCARQRCSGSDGPSSDPAGDAGVYLMRSVLGLQHLRLAAIHGCHKVCCAALFKNADLMHALERWLFSGAVWSWVTPTLAPHPATSRDPALPGRLLTWFPF
jgi:hypothetical protein